MDRFIGEFGDEVLDYSQAFQADGVTVVETAVIFYDQAGVAVRAASATVDDVAGWRVLYAGNKDVRFITDPDTSISDRTAMIRMLGDDLMPAVADYGYFYRQGTTVVRDTRIYFYGVPPKRAWAAPGAAQTAVVRYRGLKDPALVSTPGSAISQRVAIDWMVGEAGKEIVDYEHGYRPGWGTVSTTAIRFYKSGVRASNAVPDDTLLLKVLYRGLKNPTAVTAPDVDIAGRVAKVYQVGVRGHEIENYRFGYKIGTTVVVETEISFYDYGRVRATAGLEAPLTAKTVYVGSKSPTDVVSPDVPLTNRVRLDLYVGEPGDEAKDIAYRFTRSSTTVRSTDVFFYYDAGYKRASMASTTTGYLQLRVQYEGLKDTSAITAPGSDLVGRTGLFYMRWGMDDYALLVKKGLNSVTETRVWFYPDAAGALVRAASAPDDSAPALRVDYRGLKAVGTLTDPDADLAQRIGVTTCAGGKDDILRTYEEGSKIVRHTTVFYYGSAYLRATDANKLEERRKSERFAGDSLDPADKLATTTYGLNELPVRTLVYVQLAVVDTHTISYTAEGLASKAVNQAGKLVMTFSYEKDAHGNVTKTIVTDVADGSKQTYDGKEDEVDAVLNFYGGDMGPAMLAASFESPDQKTIDAILQRGATLAAKQPDADAVPTEPTMAGSPLDPNLSISLK
jgi:hypothetical protein